MKKYLLLGVSFLAGCVFTTLILFGQIQNRYEMGVRAGKIAGTLQVFQFIKENIKGESQQKYLEMKDNRLEAVEKNGVRTFQIR